MSKKHYGFQTDTKISTGWHPNLIHLTDQITGHFKIGHSKDKTLGRKTSLWGLQYPLLIISL